MLQLPRGANLPMTISYHDNTGLKFDVTDANTQYRPNQFDSLVILERNDSISVELVREEFTVLKVDSRLKDREDVHDFIILSKLDRDNATIPWPTIRRKRRFLD